MVTMTVPSRKSGRVPIIQSRDLEASSEGKQKGTNK